MRQVLRRTLTAAPGPAGQPEGPRRLSGPSFTGRAHWATGGSESKQGVTVQRAALRGHGFVETGNYVLSDQKSASSWYMGISCTVQDRNLFFMYLFFKERGDGSGQREDRILSRSHLRTPEIMQTRCATLIDRATQMAQDRNLQTSRLFRASSILTLGPEFSPYTLLTSELDNSWLRSHTEERLTASLGSLDTTWQ